MKRLSTLFMFSCLAVMLMIPSCSINPVTGKKQIMFMSEAQEIQMGTQYDPQVIATFGEYQKRHVNYCGVRTDREQ